MHSNIPNIELACIVGLRHVGVLTCSFMLQDHINEEIARLNALEERIMNESGPDDERLQAWKLLCTRLCAWLHSYGCSIETLRHTTAT